MSITLSLSDINPKSYFGCAFQVNSDDPRQIEWQEQRLSRGFDDTEIWSLDSTIIEFILPRLKYYLESDKKLRDPDNKCFSIKEKEEIRKYHSDLENIIEMFEKYEVSLYGEQLEKFNQTMQLFAKIFPTLWT